VALNSVTNSIHFAAYDGNGNVVGLVCTTNGAVAANYEYDPFGQTIRMSGVAAKDNPWRFSTKRVDNETDLVWYEYRAYSPSLGRFISRDPVGETGGNNLYRYVRNCPSDGVDRLGLKECTCYWEVTRPLKGALLRLELTFWGWPQPIKRVACNALNDYLDPGAFRNWDIEPLYTWGTTDMLVSFRHRCYYASAVNYSMWGAANRMCYEAARLYWWEDANGPLLNHWSLDRTLWWARFWKHTIWEDYSDRAEQAFAFTIYGYTGSLAHRGVPGYEWEGREYPFNFNWFWSPYNPKPRD
jgi:RHS repeat-associated protein